MIAALKAWLPATAVVLAVLTLTEVGMRRFQWPWWLAGLGAAEWRPGVGILALAPRHDERTMKAGPGSARLPVSDRGHRSGLILVRAWPHMQRSAGLPLQLWRRP